VVVGVDGLISAVVVTVCGASSSGAGVIRALPAEVSTDATFEATVSADTVDVGWVPGVLVDVVDVVDELFLAEVATFVVARDLGVTLVFAPPLACTVPSRGSDADASGTGAASDPEVESASATAGVLFTAGPSAGLDLGVESCGVWVDSDVDVVSAGALLSGAATATHGDVATAAPSPSATANAPTRPT
jgi:hypothetical protein